jgi:predicted lactoylglutathione lyase
MNPITMSLPVRNLAVSRAFFAELGFRFAPGPPDADSACLVLDEDVRILLVAEDRFRDRMNKDASHGESAGDVLISVPAQSEQAADEIVMRAIIAGGKPWPVVAERSVHGGRFQDPDGYLWQVTLPAGARRAEPAASGSRGT